MPALVKFTLTDKDVAPGDYDLTLRADVAYVDRGHGRVSPCVVRIVATSPAWKRETAFSLTLPPAATQEALRGEARELAIGLCQAFVA